jgi:type II secretory pathway component PulF
MSTFFNKNQLLVLLSMFLIPVIGYIYFGRTMRGQKQLQIILRAVPPIRKFMNSMAIQRMTDTLANLIQSGMPLMEAIKITSDTVGNEEFKNALLHINENISRGMTVGEAFKREKIFPSILSNLLSIGEKAGHISEILLTLSNFYRKELENQLKMLVALIEPTILIFMGVGVGAIAISVIVPMYQMIGGVGTPGGAEAPSAY